MECLSQDVEGLLSLYEASQLSIQGEDVLEEARKFTHDRLKILVDHMDNVVLAKQVQNSLASPLQWRMTRLESRNFIDLYEKDDSRNMDLLELAKLDFNIVQSIHQEDFIGLSRWWNELGISAKLPFSRDRIMENFIWLTGIIYEPQYSKRRVDLTKFICILTIIDGIYDIYGLLDELELFTEAVNIGETFVDRTWWKQDGSPMVTDQHWCSTCKMHKLQWVVNDDLGTSKDEMARDVPSVRERSTRVCKGLSDQFMEESERGVC